MKYGYARVSTDEQNSAPQLAALKKAGCKTIFRQGATGVKGEVEMESEWTANKRERAAGRLCPLVELPHSSQQRLEWATHNPKGNLCSGHFPRYILKPDSVSPANPWFPNGFLS